MDLADELTLGDLALWQAYYELEPWGEERADYRAAMIAHTTWSMLYAQGGRRPPRNVRLEDFLILPPEGGRRRGKFTDSASAKAYFEALRVQIQGAGNGA